MGVKLQSALGGSVELNAPSTASNFTMTVPAGNGTVATTDQLMGFRNTVINGNFDIWQRGTTFSTSNAYTVDRWLINPGNSTTPGTQSLSQQTFTAQELSSFGIQTPSYFARFTSAGASGGTVGSQFFQRIERTPSRLFDKAGMFTVSFYAKSSNVSTIRVRIQSSGNMYYSDDCSLTSSWQKFTRTITIPSDNNANRPHDEIAFSLPVSVNGTVDFAQVQLEKGSVATPFEFRPYGLELSLCQRFYQHRVPTWGTPRSTDNYIHSCGFFKTSMRVSPTLTLVENTYGQTIGIQQQNTEYYVTGAQGTASASLNAFYNADAEL